MNRLLSVISLVLLGLTACTKDPQVAAFTGTWNFTDENAIASVSETVQVTVNAAPPKFRIATAAETSETIDVYDGASLHKKYIYKPLPPSAYGAESPMDDAGSAFVPEPRTESTAMSKEQAAAQRFWAQPISGDSSPGGLIAGRDTVLHESKWKRPDGEFSTQVWIDSKTGILLKSVESIYSSQVQSLVRRTTKECVAIDFTPPADAAFVQP